jgi:hypothetical protein
MISLAFPDQLGAFLKEPIDSQDATALLLLDIASGMVRDFLQIGDISAVLADVMELDPIISGGGPVLLLPALPVTAVTLVETFDGTAWSTADPTTYTVSKRLGIITAVPWTGVTWPVTPESWRVTYDHGFDEVPMSIVGAVLGAAARQWNTDNGIDMERVGGYQVKYAMEANGFTGIELKALGAYVNPRIA